MTNAVSTVLTAYGKAKPVIKAIKTISKPLEIAFDERERANKILLDEEYTKNATDFTKEASRITSEIKALALPHDARELEELRGELADKVAQINRVKRSFFEARQAAGALSGTGLPAALYETTLGPVENLWAPKGIIDQAQDAASALRQALESKLTEVETAIPAWKRGQALGPYELFDFEASIAHAKDERDLAEVLAKETDSAAVQQELPRLRAREEELAADINAMFKFATSLRPDLQAPAKDFATEARNAATATAAFEYVRALMQVRSQTIRTREALEGKIPKQGANIDGPTSPALPAPPTSGPPTPSVSPLPETTPEAPTRRLNQNTFQQQNLPLYREQLQQLAGRASDQSRDAAAHAQATLESHAEGRTQVKRLANEARAQSDALIDKGRDRLEKKGEQSKQRFAAKIESGKQSFEQTAKDEREAWGATVSSAHVTAERDQRDQAQEAGEMEQSEKSATGAVAPVTGSAKKEASSKLPGAQPPKLPAAVQNRPARSVQRKRDQQIIIEPNSVPSKSRTVIPRNVFTNDGKSGITGVATEQDSDEARARALREFLDAYPGIRDKLDEQRRRRAGPDLQAAF